MINRFSIHKHKHTFCYREQVFTIISDFYAHAEESLVRWVPAIVWFLGGKAEVMEVTFPCSHRSEAVIAGYARHWMMAVLIRFFFGQGNWRFLAEMP